MFYLRVDVESLPTLINHRSAAIDKRSSLESPGAIAAVDDVDGPCVLQGQDG